MRRPSLMARSFVAVLLAAGAAAPAFALAPVAFTVGSGDKVFDSQSARGRYLAVHLLPAGKAGPGHVREFLAGAPTLAGVQHVFVASGTADTAALSGGNTSVPIYADTDGRLAAQIGLKPGQAGITVLVLDQAGSELFRLTSSGDADHPTFKAFADKLASATADKAVKEGNYEDGVAIAGYDPVAYIDQLKAVPGQKQLASTYRGVTYRFASDDDRAKFNADPEKYLPAYGGWCATAMAEGNKVEVDPKSFKVTNGRLFLFYKGLFGNAIEDWNKAEKKLTTDADGHWNKLVRSR